MDEHGQMFVVGFFGGTLDLGTVVLTDPGGRWLMFVAAFSTDCEVSWARSFLVPTSSVPASIGIVPRPGGGAVLAGSALGPVDLGTGMLPASTDKPGAWVMALDGAGQTLWARTFNDAGAHLGFTAIGIATDGTLVATGVLLGAIDLGTGRVDASLTGPDALVVKMNNQGTPLWARTIGGPQPDQGHGVAIGPSGSIAITGHENAFSGEDLYTREVLLAGLTARGDLAWKVKTERHGEGLAVAFDPNGELLVLGRGLPPGETEISGGPDLDKNFFLAKLDAAHGAVFWSRTSRLWSPAFTGAFALSGDVALVAGNSGRDVDFAVPDPPDAGGIAVRQWSFVVAYDTSGAHRFTLPIESSVAPTLQVLGLGGDGKGGFAIVGRFTGTITLGGLTSRDPSQADMFVARVQPAPNR